MFQRFLVFKDIYFSCFCVWTNFSIKYFLIVNNHLTGWRKGEDGEWDGWWKGKMVNGMGGERGGWWKGWWQKGRSAIVAKPAIQNKLSKTKEVKTCLEAMLGKNYLYWQCIHKWGKLSQFKVHKKSHLILHLRCLSVWYYAFVDTFSLSVWTLPPISILTKKKYALATLR